jgi:hypothetical protein
MRSSFALVLAGAALAMGLVAGCTNPFTPSTPEKPTGSAIVPVLTSPENTLATLGAALSDFASGQNAYTQAIAESTTAGVFAFYAFHFPTVVDAWHSETSLQPPNPWDRTLELKFYTYLGEVYPEYTYTWTWGPDNLSPDPPPVDDVNGLALLRRHYTLYATSADGNIQHLIAVGYADLYLQRVNGQWRLYRWEDRLDPDYGLHPRDPDNICMGRRRLDSTSGAS